MAEAIIFVPALAGCAVFGFVFALFAANHYLTVLQSTAAGARHVTWGDEPILDGFWKVFYLLWLAGVWAGPAVFASRVAGAAGWVTYVVPLAVVWVCYPVSQLSSLSGPTVWLPLHPGVFDRLLQKPAVTLGFFALSLIPLVGIGVGFYGVFRADGFPWLAIGCPLLVLSLYGYGRLLGRLAFVLMFTKSRLTRRKKKALRDDPPVQTPPPAGSADPADEDGFRQPSELPPIDTPDEGPLTGYDVRFADDPPKPARTRVRAEVVTEPASRRRPDPDEDTTPYEVNQPDGTAAEPEERIPEAVVKPREDELRLINRDDAPKKPKVVWSAEVLAFFGQQETLAAAGVLSVLCLFFGGMVRIARAFNPAAAG